MDVASVDAQLDAIELAAQLNEAVRVLEALYGPDEAARIYALIVEGIRRG